MGFGNLFKIFIAVLAVFIQTQTAWATSTQLSMEQGFATFEQGAVTKPDPIDWKFQPLENLKNRDRNKVKDYWIEFTVENRDSQNLSRLIAIERSYFHRKIELWKLEGDQWQRQESYDFTGDLFPKGQTQDLSLNLIVDGQVLMMKFPAL